MFHSNIEAYLTDEFDLLRSKEDRIKWVLRNRDLVEQGLKEVDSFLTKRTQTKRLTLFAKYFQQAKLEKQKNDLKAALKFCNKAIIYAPCDPNDDYELIIALAFRAKLLYSLGKYEESIADLDRAMKCGFGGEQLTQLMERNFEAILTHELSVREETSAIAAERNFYAQKIKGLLKKPVPDISRITTPNATVEDIQLMKNFPSSLTFWQSESCEIANVKGKGRGTVATKRIPKRTIFQFEKPIIMNITQDLKLKNCTNCCSDIEVVYPCTQCLAAFCSKKCFEEAKQDYHETECGYCLLSLLGNFSYCSYRLAHEIGFKRLLELHDHPQCSETESDEKFLKIWSLDENGDKSLLYKKASIVHSTLLTLFYLDRKGVISDWSNEQVAKLGTIIQSFTCRIETNIFGIYNYVEANEISAKIFGANAFGFSPVHRGEGVAWLGSIVNHSCVPNSQWGFVGNYIVFRSLRDINKGEEITISYGPNKNIHQVESRRAVLKMKYYFDCDCSGCVEQSKNEEKREKVLYGYSCNKKLKYEF